ncbi:MAG: hypothetical protein OXN89_05050 [Bryobacterales bacterium]|nr:hypothetical protein [Bryobacterales bacterium]
MSDRQKMTWVLKLCTACDYSNRTGTDFRDIEVERRDDGSLRISFVADVEAVRRLGKGGDEALQALVGTA